jgi:hypothetical protein
MPSIYRSQRSYADEHMPAIKALLGQALLEEANNDDDMHHATDLVIRNLRIAVRIRRLESARKFSDFTIRARTQTDTNRTEYDKIMEQSADSPDYISYCVLDGDKIVRAYLIDVPKLRHAISNGIEKRLITNPDKSAFYALPLHADYTRAIIIG